MAYIVRATSILLYCTHFTMKGNSFLLQPEYNAVLLIKDRSQSSCLDLASWQYYFIMPEWSITFRNTPKKTNLFLISNVIFNLKRFIFWGHWRPEFWVFPISWQSSLVAEKTIYDRQCVLMANDRWTWWGRKWCPVGRKRRKCRRALVDTTNSRCSMIKWGQERQKKNWKKRGLSPNFSLI